ncbi:MAG: hypothetical protein A2583_11620 [Bdellovibrionales bacterium RIFOXYD1_FULL_53_11]|nr:MAG: hypothetical protein A2583_11620 [Bdellovibrionales bacterium RIFOXYD1_FULL_53_11]
MARLAEGKDNNICVAGRHDAAVLKRIRVRKKDSAYVYCIFESYEGWLAYSTIDCCTGVPYCDLELQIPVCFEREVEDLLLRMGDVILAR